MIFNFNFWNGILIHNIQCSSNFFLKKRNFIFLKFLKFFWLFLMKFGITFIHITAFVSAIKGNCEEIVKLFLDNEKVDVNMTNVLIQNFLK